jgi:hypothetical protein
MGLDLARIDNDALAIASHVKEIHDLGGTLIASGLLPNTVRTPEAAVAIILKGRELGLPVMQSFEAIDNIQGKPTLKPQAMLALIHASPYCAGVTVEAGDNGCTVTMRRRNAEGVIEHSETFTKQDADRLGLSTKDNYKKQPRTMYKWRAVAACARVIFPDVIQNMLTPEEALAEVHADVVDVESRPTGSKADRLAGKLKAQAEPVDEFPPDPPEGFFGEPESPQEPEQAQPGGNGSRITSGQTTALSIALKSAGFKTTDDGKAQGRSFVAFLAGRDSLKSIKDLSKAEAKTVLDALGGESDGKYSTDKARLENALTAWDEARAGAQIEAEGLFDEDAA